MTAVKDSQRCGESEQMTVVAIAPASTRWGCYHHMAGSDIETYVSASDGLEVIAQTKQLIGVDAHTNAELIVRAVNNHGRYEPVIRELIFAVEQYLAGGIDWNAEQEAKSTIRRARRMLAG